jgi:uncharacterized protein (DUF433 family)
LICPPVTRSAPATTDLRDCPAYPLSEAARYLKVPPATVRSWFLGRQYQTTGGNRHFSAIVAPATRRPPVLSFWNLVEAHVLRALRTDHGVSVKAARNSVAFAEGELKIERLLLSKELLAGAGRLFLGSYGELVGLSASGQIAMRQVLEAHLKRVDWDKWQFPVRVYPFLASETITADRPIAIDPAIAFGRPVVLSRGITTSTIVERIDAGETVADLAADYDISPADVEKSILYERAA